MRGTERFQGLRDERKSAGPNHIIDCGLACAQAYLSFCASAIAQFVSTIKQVTAAGRAKVNFWVFLNSSFP
jgi:hypothetical protein